MDLLTKKRLFDIMAESERENRLNYERSILYANESFQCSPTPTLTPSITPSPSETPAPSGTSTPSPTPTITPSCTQIKLSIFKNILFKINSFLKLK